ncbi:MAG: 2-C-methyl-D-erythritol 2,4-cyclodiphosphate synthase [Eubacteriaceae bacterium]|nr:2-C-methyl-D-erythritol 2,4-cyclodiphosphate synthase [Eubacteriaceae bacterium]
MKMRVGFGYDVHVLRKGVRLVLCGVEIDYGFGLVGHSDADVSVHALIDALLGAAGLGDIGIHFPDTEPTFAGVSSISLLSEAYAMVKREGYTISNADITIVAEKPKLSGYFGQMRGVLAETLETEPSKINVKAKTEEGLGFTGNQEGIKAYAVCILTQPPIISITPKLGLWGS